METYGRRTVLLCLTSIFLCLSARAEPFLSECKFAVELPPKTNLQKSEDTSRVLCSYYSENKYETPFVNSISAISWSNLKDLKIDGEPLQNVGFFRLLPSRSIKYIGRPSYADTQNGYVQKVIRTSTAEKIKDKNDQTLIIQTDIRVKWIKKIASQLEKEENEVFTCVDAANYDDRSIAILNWCAPKSSLNEKTLLQLAKSLKISP